MKNYSLDELTVEHDYYCNDDNYFSNDARLKYNCWEEFYDEFEDADIDMNLVFRWDMSKSTKKYTLKLYMIQQRKGIFTPIIVKDFKEENINEFIKYITPHIKKLENIWKPFKLGE